LFLATVVELYGHQHIHFVVLPESLAYLGWERMGTGTNVCPRAALYYAGFGCA